ncbi:MAG TPA: hypothetical protein VL171_04480 [Verrucomicrobiae bacterium]|nr:hypothetical protein [Verrucomicrobiae bacterium]
MGLIFLILMRQDFFAAAAILYVAGPFAAAAPLCAIYGMCVGHVKHGLLLLGAMGFLMGLSYWAVVRESMNAAASIQQQMFQQMQKQIPQIPHP